MPSNCAISGGANMQKWMGGMHQY